MSMLKAELTASGDRTLCEWVVNYPDMVACLALESVYFGTESTLCVTCYGTHAVY